MATSFAAYASQYLHKHGSDTVSSSQPMFFSFTTDDGDRHAETDLEDLDDPHLHAEQEDVDDPYLKLDESPPGWLAHLTNSPRRSRSRSSSPHSSGSDAPPPELLAAPARSKPHPHPQPKHTRARSESPPLSLGPTQLTESLLPRAGADVFNLPDPRHTSRKRRKHHDALWTALWLGSVSVSFVLCVVLLFTTRRPPHFPAAFLPYAILLRTVPVLTLLTLLSAAAAYAHVWLLRLFAGPVMMATSVLVPATLFVSAVWAFVGSFMWEAGVEPTWGETVGLRLFAIIPLVLSIITARRLLHLPQHIHRTSSTLTLATHMLITNPFLAALSPALLLAMLLASLPFLTAVFRLLLIGYGTGGAKEGWEWHVRAWANWGIVGVLAVWLWSWAVVRGTLRMTAASVVGAWYFSDPSLPPPPPNSTHTIHAAITRSTGPSLGTICISALLLTLLRMLTVTLLILNRIPTVLVAIPFASYGMAGVGAAVSTGVVRWVIPVVGWIVGYVEGWKSRVSRYVLVYCGLTGTGFWDGAGRAGALVSGMEIPEPRESADVEEVGRQQSRGTRQGRRARGSRQARKIDFGTEPSLSLLTISPLTLTLPFSLLTYLFVVHTLGAPNEALGAALLAAGTTGMVGVFCVGLVRDCADTLYLCYCIDKAHGKRTREEVFIAFEYDGTANGDIAPAGLPGSMVLPMHRQHGAFGIHSQLPGVPTTQRSGRTSKLGAAPETIIPRSPLDATGASAAHMPSVRRQETLFDAPSEDEDDEASNAGGRTLRGQHRPSGRSKAPVPRAKMAPLASYMDSDVDSVDENASRTPTVGLASASRHGHVREEEDEEEDEMNPFHQSAVADEEAALGARRISGGAAYPFATVSTSPTTAAQLAMAMGTPPGTSPLSAGRPGFGFVGAHGHTRSGSGAGAALLGTARGREPALPGGERMLSSTQELNMKSQFLMNMRAFGADSEASAAGSTGAGGASGHEGGGASGYEGYMEESGVASVPATVSASRQGQRNVEEPNHVRESGTGGEKSEGEESMLGPGSGFFN